MQTMLKLFPFIFKIIIKSIKEVNGLKSDKKHIRQEIQIHIIKN